MSRRPDPSRRGTGKPRRRPHRSQQSAGTRPNQRRAAKHSPRTGREKRDGDPNRRPTTRETSAGKSRTERVSRPSKLPDLPEGWIPELRNTVRPQKLDRVASLIDQALDAFQEDKYPEAAQLAEQAKAEAPRSARIRELLGLSYYRNEQWHDALRELLTYRRLTGHKDQSHVIADCYRADGRTDKVLQTVNEVFQKEVPPDVWAELLIVGASTLADMGDIPRAIAQLARADLKPKKVEPYHLRLWYVRADLLEKAGRMGEAKKEWEAIAAEDPDFYDVSDRLRM
jgi:tetratricopeptide (TPR) repeat protein